MPLTTGVPVQDRRADQRGQRLRRAVVLSFSVNTPALRSLYDNLPEQSESGVRDTVAQFIADGDVDSRELKAIKLDRAIRDVKRADWRGNNFKEREVLNAMVQRSGMSSSRARCSRL